MSSNEQMMLEKLVEHAGATRSLLSNKHRTDRERMVVRATLRMLDIPFEESEIVAHAEQNSDIDIFFRAARFQLKDLLGGRKRGDDWRKREARWKAAKTIAETSEPFQTSVPLSLERVVQEVAKTLGAKLYGDRSSLDALVYVDAPCHLYPPPPGLRFESPAELVNQGWRSVTVLSLPYAAVLTASGDAPDELKQRVGHLHYEPDAYKIDTAFDE